MAVPKLEEGRTASNRPILKDATLRRLFFGSRPLEVRRQAGRKLRTVIVPMRPGGGVR